jgi:hypothetical protein
LIGTKKLTTEKAYKDVFLLQGYGIEDGSECPNEGVGAHAGFARLVSFPVTNASSFMCRPRSPRMGTDPSFWHCRFRLLYRYTCNKNRFLSLPCCRFHGSNHDDVLYRLPSHTRCIVCFSQHAFRASAISTAFFRIAINAASTNVTTLLDTCSVLMFAA